VRTPAGVTSKEKRIMDVSDLILGSWSIDGIKIVTFHKDSQLTLHAHLDLDGEYSLNYDKLRKIWQITAIYLGIINGEIIQIDNSTMKIKQFLQSQGTFVEAGGDISFKTDIIFFTRCNEFL
jgi:hypothetical protein